MRQCGLLIFVALILILELYYFAFMTFIYSRRNSHETDVSTQQGKAESQIRVPGPDENPGREAYFEAPAGKGPD
jgi:hypothetical protein